MRIVIAEDDLDLLDITSYTLRKYGYDVTGVTDGNMVLRRVETAPPDLLLLDVNLPGMSGYEVCRRVRSQWPNIPIIMLTGRKSEPDVLKGFQIGADDYITKPFNPRELAMRVRAVLQRKTGAALPQVSWEFRVGSLSLDMESHQVARHGAEVQLTPLEFRILQLLAINVGRVVPSTRLAEFAWGYDCGDASLLKSHVSRIRTKLNLQPDQPGYIKSVPRVGYQLVREEMEAATAA